MHIKLFLISFALFLTSSCGNTDVSLSEKKPLLLVSIAPYQSLVQRIAGSDFEVQTVVPSNSNPHSFEPTSSQVAKIGRAQVWFLIGEPFEKKIEPILKSRNPDLTIIDLRDGIELIEEHGLSCEHCAMDHLDRHIWLSPKLAQKQAIGIEKALQTRYPEKTFGPNLTQLSEDLAQLDLEIREILKPVANRTLVVSHPAFGYFCKDYHFVQLSIEYEGKDPRPKHLTDTLNQAVAHSAEIALSLPQYNNKGAQLIAEKLHLPIRQIDPYSSDYFETMRKLAHLIAEPYAPD